MKKQNSNSGKWIAVVMIVAFFAINYFKSENEAGPQEQMFAKVKQEQTETRKLDDKIAPTQNIEKLKFAYTGKWEKNTVSTQQNYQFVPPANGRNNTHPTVVNTAAKKKDDKKKKKIAAKKKKSNKLMAKKSRGKSIYDLSDDRSEYNAPTGGFAAAAYYQQQAAQNRSPSEDEKKLSLKEWLDLIEQTKSIDELISQHSSGTVSTVMFTSIVKALLSSEEDEMKKLGFQGLQAIPSAPSLELYVQHIDDDMSAETKAFAESTLSAYSQPNHLRVLNSVLNSGNDKVRILAATLIRNITTAVLAAETNSGENTTYSQTQIESFRAQLTNSLFVINNAFNSVQGDVRDSFDSARRVLVQFLS